MDTIESSPDHRSRLQAPASPRVGRGLPPSPITLADAQAYCRKLVRSHYENFTVASWFLPRHLRSHFYHIYAYCRWADDLADETASPTESLALLAWWENELRACYAGRAVHPVFVALRQTTLEFAIPIEPFLDLLVAFRRDQRPERYESIDQLLDYCRYSANPVGRLVLHLGGYHDPERVRLSDAVCTGLQLANLWQDLARDTNRGRIYLPREVCRRHGYDDRMLAERQTNDAFRHLMAAEVERAERLLRHGLPLAEMVTPELRREVQLFVAGGLEVLGGIRRIGYDVWRTRPVVGRMTKLRLLFRYGWGRQPKIKGGGGS